MNLSLKGLNRFVELGISAETSAEDRRSIRLVNILNFVTGGSALILGPALTKITGKPIFTPGLIEASLFALSLVLNARKKHFAAAMLMLTTQNIAAAYFGILLGQGISIKMLSLGLAITAVFLFHTTKTRAIALAFGFLPMIFLNLNVTYDIITPWTFTPGEHELIKWLADIVISAICMVIVITFVQQNQRSSANKTVFLRESNHEINKSLNSVLPTLQTYLNKPHSGTIPLQAKDLQIIDVGVRTILDTVKNGLDFAKIEQGKFDEYAPEIIDIRKFIKDIRISYHSLAAKKGITIKTDLSAKVPRWFISDKEQLFVIISNIISNAIKFSYNDAVVELKITHEENSLQFEIVDHGKGMSEARQRSIFQGLFVSEKNDLLQGYGIGMVMTGRKVQSLGGNITVHSIEGAGTRFKVCIPIEIPDSPTVETHKLDLHNSIKRQSQDPQLNLSDKIVLIIDDDPNTQYALAALLGQYACADIYVAENAKAGVEIAQAIVPDLIFLDVQLPDDNKFITLRRLRAMDGYKDIPIISISAENSDIVRRETKKAGATVFLHKPVGYKDFQKNIEEIFHISV